MLSLDLTSSNVSHTMPVGVGSVVEALKLPEELRLSKSFLCENNKKSSKIFFASPKPLYRYSGGKPHVHMVITN